MNKIDIDGMIKLENILKEKDKEIERLNNINNQQTSDIQVLMYEKENLERLVARKDNIIDELEKWLRDEYSKYNGAIRIANVLDKIKELKEGK